MDSSLAGLVPSPRRRRDAGDTSMRRTGSHHSSTSSDILVAGPSLQSPPRHSSHQKQQESTPARLSRSNTLTMTRAYTQYGHLTVRFGTRAAKERLRAILQSRSKPSFGSSDDESDSQSDEEELEQDEDAEGPNDRGTYSREYTLKHPETKWVHRGQGRYLPASEIKVEPVTSSPRPTRLLPERATASSATSTQAFEEMYQMLWESFNEFRLEQNPLARPGWSPQLRGSYNGIMALLKGTQRPSWPRAVESIENPDHREVVRKWVKAMEKRFPTSHAADPEQARPSRLPSRQAKTVVYPSNDHRRSSRLVDTIVNTYDESEDDVEDDVDEESEHDDDEDESEVAEEDPSETFSKNYVEAHPHEEFYHAGSGRYRRGSRVTAQNKLAARRESSTSQAIKYSSSEASHDMSADLAVKKEDLHKHAGRIFHHRGNQFYRPGVSPHGIKGTKLVLASGELLGLHDLHKRDAEELLAKAAKRNFGIADPRSAASSSRNLGRRKSSQYSLAAESTALSLSSGRRASKIENSLKGENDDLPGGGARRWSSKSNLEVKDVFATLKPTRTKSDPDMLHDRDYVDAHPDEIFHHRGQGKWARGLPPPGSSNKMAVRGPGAKEMFEAMHRGEEVDANGKQPPPITALLRKEEGPDLYPQFTWHYRGGGKHCRLTKEEAERYEESLRPVKRQRTSTGSRARGEGPEAQLQREALAAEAGSGKARADLLQRPTRAVRKRSQQNASQHGVNSKASSFSESKAPTPKPAPLAPELDRLTEDDLPGLYKDEWSDLDEQDPDDEAAHILRQRFQPIVGADPFVVALTKYDPAARSLESLKLLAGNAQKALLALQDEYLELDKVVARHPMNGKKERKPMQGGREPVSHAMWEDKKEAALYDYAFDPRKVGYQDPDNQRIVRDAEGRELRRRRNRNDLHATQVNYGDGEMTTRRTVKPVSRFDGVIVPVPRKKSRLAVADTTETDLLIPTSSSFHPPGSITPERTSTPTWNGDPNDYVPPIRGRWAGHVPKRIQELRGLSLPRRSESNSPQPSASSSGNVRKGRPPGSKNLHERKDKGIKKGPRKKKPESTPVGEEGDTENEDLSQNMEDGGVGAGEMATASSKTRPENPMSLDAIVG
ncbi:hypothetical protein Slin15195_G021320 [Septoria linicola]|uniref:Uncharacterized protein n=1 Tax=Septoria linicola TaxID=215465 RepID=A0A9Q9EH04_9PEZI|nr:hypothetical protein Slin15195_G021320 [Septoria linicola]